MDNYNSKSQLSIIKGVTSNHDRDFDLAEGLIRWLRLSQKNFYSNDDKEHQVGSAQRNLVYSITCIRKREEIIALLKVESYLLLCQGQLAHVPIYPLCERMNSYDCGGSQILALLKIASSNNITVRLVESVRKSSFASVIY
jgi:hypothetical protein